MSKLPLLQCQQISKFYQDGEQKTQVLQQVSFSLQAGEMMAIVGSSGSGKSTLLHILGALDEASSGEVIFQGQSLSQLNEAQKATWRNRSLGFIYQFHHLLADFTALENVAMPLLIAGKPRQQAEQIAQEMLQAVGLTHRLAHRPGELSGGERQRVAIARAIANQPALVLADEPTGNLDQKNAQEVLTLLKNLNQQYGMAFLIVTHDLTLAKRLDSQLTMQDGKLLQSEIHNELFSLASGELN